jgi:hypothetical protein
MYQQVIRNPFYGSEGRPYRVVVVMPAGGPLQMDFWTERQALDCRDQYFDLGYAQVRVLGLPTIVWGS